jgi:hypothetical protein
MSKELQMRPKRVLVAYSASSTYVTATVEYLMALKNFTDYDVKYVHVTHNAQMHFDINEFDVLFHNYCARLCFDGYLSPDYERAVASFRGLKIAAVQDDYDRTITLHRAIRRLGFQVVLTCIQSDFWPLAYPQSQIPGVRLLQGLTGYVPANISERANEIIPLSDRKNLIAYRGRDIGARYGRLGFEKLEIGRRMIEICNASGIPHDIAMDDASRIYGDDWFRFLGNSRTMLGSESASNAFDFDEVIEKRFKEFEEIHGRPPRYRDIADFIEPFERPFDVGQISPRVFECAIMRTPMILFRGRYSDAIEAGVHYIPLEKDFSNAGEILSKLHDLDFLQGFADRAYDHLVASGNYGYRSLADLISGAIEEQYPALLADPFVEHRTERSVPWAAPELPNAVKSYEDAVKVALGEKPTDYPQTLSDFQAKLDSPILREMSARKRNMNPVLRTIWLALPKRIRYRLGPALRGVAQSVSQHL